MPKPTKKRTQGGQPSGLSVIAGSASPRVDKEIRLFAEQDTEPAAQINYLTKLARRLEEELTIAVAALESARQIKPSYESRRATIDRALERISSPNTQLSRAPRRL